MDADEIGRLIGELENRVERLRSLYEQYFMGIERLEPLTARKDVDRRLWTLRREQIRNTGLRFKLETTVQRYNTYQQYWQRIVREIEQGTYQRDLGRAAQRFGDNAVTGFAKRRQKMFENALSKKAERDARRTGSQAPAPEAGPDGGPPSSNETLDVTFEEAEPASTRAPLPGAAAVPPAPMAPPRPAPGVPPMAPPSPFARPGGAVPPPVPPPRPPMASSLGQGAQQPPNKPGAAIAPAAKPSAPIAPAQPIAAATAAKPPTPVATAARPAAPVATPARPPTPIAAAAKPTPVATPAKPPTPPASPAVPTSPMVTGSQANAASAPKPAASPAREPLVHHQSPFAASAPKPAADPVERMPPARPPAASRPDARPAVLSEDNSLSPIRMRQIYGQFVEAKRKANESTASVTYEKIASNLENVAKELRAKHKARSVDFEVVMKNGKPVLKPVVKS